MGSIAEGLSHNQQKRRDELLVLLAGYSWLRWHHRDGLLKVVGHVGSYRQMGYDDPDKLQAESDLIWLELRAIVSELMGSPRLISEADLVAQRADLSRADLAGLRGAVPVIDDSPLREELRSRALEAAPSVTEYAPRFSIIGWAQRKAASAPRAQPTPAAVTVEEFVAHFAAQPIGDISPARRQRLASHFLEDNA